MPLGTRALSAWNLETTSTTPAHGVLVTGSSRPFTKTGDSEHLNLQGTALPTLLEAYRQQVDADQTQVLLLANTVHLEMLRWPLAGSDFASEWTYLEDNAMDWVGHSQPESYTEALARVSPDLVETWDLLQDSPTYRDQTWLFFLADHGRHDLAAYGPLPWKEHGCACNGCRPTWPPPGFRGNRCS